MENYLWLIPAAPAVGVLINAFFGRRLPRAVVSFISCGVVGLAFVFSVAAFVTLLKLPEGGRQFVNTLYTWIAAGSFRADAAFLFDPLSAVMALVVSGVGFLIHVYSVGYMHDEKSYSRYFTYLNLFTFSMLILVLADNFLLMFVGWEGVGLCSYFLIGFWYEKKSASDAGKKAFIVNRIGDFGFALGIMLVFMTFGTIDFIEVFHDAPHTLAMGGGVVTAITLLFFVGAIGKSAQIPLYTWLPDAMEGPTPVSALIHAATMVTAGVYMVARCSVLYSMAPVSMTVVAVIGAATAIFAATIGLAQNDIKRVLAYSTISQLGYMFLACGVGAFSAGIFHLMTHAFFKALLFLGSGSVIHAMSGKQDMREMGGLRRYAPITFVTFFVATLAIAGCPMLSGFFSKDLILEEAFMSTHGHWLLWLVGFFAAGLTSFYMFRLVFMTFFGECRADEKTKHHIHESPLTMTIPLMVLAVLAAVGGFIGVPQAVGDLVGWDHSNIFDAFLAPALPVLEGAHGGDAHHGGHGGGHGLAYVLMAASVGIAALGFLLSWYMYVKNPQAPARFVERFRAMHTLIYNKYYVDEIYNTLFVQPFFKLSRFLWKGFDDAVVDGTVNGVAKTVQGLSSVMRRIQTGQIQGYAFSILVGTILILGFLILR